VEGRKGLWRKNSWLLPHRLRFIWFTNHMLRWFPYRHHTGDWVVDNHSVTALPCSY